jgi:hypothetical protein
VAIEDGLHLLGGLIEVTRHFDLAVTDARDFGNGAGDVRLHHFADGIELQADRFDAADALGYGLS